MTPARPLPRTLTSPSLRDARASRPQDQGLSAEGRRGRIEGNVGAGEAAERKEGGRKGAREGRVQEKLAEKGLREQGPLLPSPPAPHTSGRRVQGPRA